MYKLGHQLKHHYWRYLIILGVIMAVLSGVKFVPKMFRADTTLKQAPVVTRHVSAGSSTTQHLVKGVFSMDIPTGWKVADNLHNPYADSMYSWAGSAGDDAARRIDVYIDRLPADLAVNSLQVVEANRDHMDVIGSPSPNCVGFTDKTSQATTIGKAPAKWQGVNFLCDIANYERDVVGTGSTGGINITVLTGTHKGKHRVFLAYTDNNVGPDYSTFTAMIRSFRIL